MSNHSPALRLVAIACGGTGGHLFPGMAIAEKLTERGCDVILLVSPKQVDQQVVKQSHHLHFFTLPAVGLQRRGLIKFLRGFYRSHKVARRLFRVRSPDAVLAMGGFTSVPPILAAKSLGARTFLHESNTVPGRANRCLSWVVDHAFVGFASAGARFRRCRVTVCGTPARSQFRLRDVRSCRLALGLDPSRPVLLVMGGSQGANSINDLVARSLPLFAKSAPECQWFHLTGAPYADELRQIYADLRLSAVVHPFFDRMELALGAASAALSRAGASSLAEVAAMRLPCVLIPFPSATNDHQLHNARAYAGSGAACLLEQNRTTPELLMNSLLELARDQVRRETMQAALAQWDRPDSSSEIAESILEGISPTMTSCLIPQKASKIASGVVLPVESNAAMGLSSKPIIATTSEAPATL